MITTITIRLTEDASVDHEAIWGQFQMAIEQFNGESDAEFGIGKVLAEITSIEEQQ